ncbi:MAG: hypothetical protein ACH34Y_09270 [Brachymonas sp.]|jgi:hypothetical protein
MRIHQLSASYEAIHDRILLRINTHEGQQLQLWFTQRLLRQLLPSLLRLEQQLALQSAAAANPQKTQNHSPEAQAMLADLKREEFLQRSDFATPYREPKPAQAEAALQTFLLTQVRLSMAAETQITVDFEEQLEQDAPQRQLQLQLTAEIYIGMVDLLKRSVLLAQWPGMLAELSLYTPSPDATGTDQDLHLW